jgi:hypothetical protein
MREARRRIAMARMKEVGLRSPRTVPNACTRALGITQEGFDELAWRWLSGQSRDLQSRLQSKANDDELPAVLRFFSGEDRQIE